MTSPVRGHPPVEVEEPGPVCVGSASDDRIAELRTNVCIARRFWRKGWRARVKRSGLLVEESVALAGIGQRADIELAEDLVAIAGNNLVQDVANHPRQYSPEETTNAPAPSEFAEDVGHGIGAGDESFLGLLVVRDDVERLEIDSIGSITTENLSGERALQRGEAEEILAIMLEGELDEAVAESAKAVVEEDGVRGHTILW